MIGIAGAALDFGAPARDLVDQSPVIGKLRAVVLEKSLLNSSELELDDLLHDIVGDRIVRNDNGAAQERRLKDLE